MAHLIGPTSTTGTAAANNQTFIPPFGGDCLGTLRITGVSRALQVPSPNPDPHRCPWERFAPRQSFWLERLLVGKLPASSTLKNSSRSHGRRVAGPDLAGHASARATAAPYVGLLRCRSQTA